jgi:hypothetical protein
MGMSTLLAFSVAPEKPKDASSFAASRMAASMLGQLCSRRAMLRAVKFCTLNPMSATSLSTRPDLRMRSFENANP